MKEFFQQNPWKIAIFITLILLIFGIPTVTGDVKGGTWLLGITVLSAVACYPNWNIFEEVNAERFPFCDSAFSILLILASLILIYLFSCLIYFLFIKVKK